MDVNIEASKEGDRTLFHIDVENLCVEPLGAGTEEALHAITTALSVGNWHEGDHVRIAAKAVLMLHFAWHVSMQSSMHALTGPDGADLPLLEHHSPGFVADRFDRLVVASGDHIFADLVTDAVRAGVSTAVVSLPQRVSWTLWASGANVVEVEPTAPARGAVRPMRGAPQRRTAEVGCAIPSSDRRVLR